MEKSDAQKIREIWDHGGNIASHCQHYLAVQICYYHSLLY